MKTYEVRKDISHKRPGSKIPPFRASAGATVSLPEHDEDTQSLLKHRQIAELGDATDERNDAGDDESQGKQPPGEKPAPKPRAKGKKKNAGDDESQG